MQVFIKSKNIPDNDKNIKYSKKQHTNVSTAIIHTTKYSVLL